MSENIIQKSFVTNVNKVTRITISSKNAIKIKHLSMKKFKTLTKLNPKMAGGRGGSIWTASVVFRKVHLLKRGRNFIEFPRVVQKVWRNSLSILANFHRFFGFFDITYLQRNEWLQLITDDVSIFSLSTYFK